MSLLLAIPATAGREHMLGRIAQEVSKFETKI